MRSAPKQKATIDPVYARQQLLTAISSAPEPLSMTTLGTLPDIGAKLSGPKVKELLGEDMKRGDLFAWAVGKKACMWNRNPDDIAKQRLLDLSAKAVLTGIDLDKKAGKQSPPIGMRTLKAVRSRLQREGLLREVGAAPGSKAKRLIHAQHPEPYLEEEIARLLHSFGLMRSAEQIRNLLAPGTLAPPQTQETKADEDTIREVADKIFDAVNRIAFSPGTTVTFYRLRQQPELIDIPKAIFDRAALLLQSERKAHLSVHDHAAALPQEEQDLCVTDGLGHFYVSAYARGT